MMKNQGWFKNWMFALIAAVVAVISVQAEANTLSVREISVTGKNQIEIQFDGVIAQGNLNLDYVRDNVQFSFQNATIYPAKMIHSDDSSFNKIFAYQYSPSLVRIRFTVDGQAENYKGKVNWVQRGKTISITFPENVSVQAQKKSAPRAVAAAKVENKAQAATPETNSDLDEQKERSLLSRVLGKGPAVDEEQKAQPEKAQPQIEAKSVVAREKNSNKSLTGQAQLGGAKKGPSAGRAFLALFLIVGGLGAVLFVLKKKKGSLQAKVVGNTWWSNFLPSSMRKPKSFIEVMGQHSLGAKQSIVVVKIRGQQFVLGVTQDNVQLITQLDADEAEVDLLSDVAVTETIGKMFGSKPTAAPVTNAASFENMVKGSNGAGAIVGRNAYQAQMAPASFDDFPLPPYGGQSAAPAPAAVALRSTVAAQPSVRDQIRRRLDQGMRNA